MEKIIGIEKHAGKVRKIIFHTLSLIMGCQEKKKSKCVENGRRKLEITRNIKRRFYNVFTIINNRTINNLLGNLHSF